MSLIELVRTALHSLRINPLRSALSILGVIFGIAAVIVLISLGQGVRSQISDQIKGLGMDILVVKSGQEETEADVNPSAGQLAGQLNTSTLIQADVAEVARVDGIKAVCGTIDQMDVARAGERAMNGKVTGGDKDFRKARKLEFSTTAEGWSYENQQKGTCAIGPTAAERLFGTTENVVGKTLSIGSREFEVKGLVTRRKKSLFLDPNKEIYITMDDAREMYGAPGTDKVKEIYATMQDPNKSKETEAEIIKNLENAHRQRFEQANPGKQYEKDFYVANQEDLMSSYRKILSILNALVFGIALVALIESGIGVSNIMYIAVKERTREIGVRLAQGASKRAILIQFLIESMTICLLGASIGIPLGWLTAVIINGNTILPAQTPLWGICVAFGAALVVGVIAGVYPAWKATKADIAVALRAE